jgi:hypothetical protein
MGILKRILTRPHIASMPVVLIAAYVMPRDYAIREGNYDQQTS